MLSETRSAYAVNGKHAVFRLNTEDVWLVLNDKDI